MELPFLPDRDRYWETRFGDLRPSRLAGGHRRYSRTDLEFILEIKDLVHRRKLTVAGARRALLDRKRGVAEHGPSAPASADGGPSLKLLREVKKEIRMLVDEFGR
jgi:DNA-binding transcriptional MerR regulator